MQHGFSKRIFTAKSFLVEFGFLVWHLPKIIAAFTARNRPKQLLEKVVLVVDAVNGCIYCSWLDAKLAMNSGMSKEEVKNVLDLEFQADVSKFELVALLYAQHYAETNGAVDSAMTSKLYDQYGAKTAEQLRLMIRTVTFGNLYFNTWGAVISRFTGNPVPNSNVVFEVFYFLLNFWIITPFVILRRLDKKVVDRTHSLTRE